MHTQTTLWCAKVQECMQSVVVLPHDDAPALLIVLVNPHLQHVVFCVDVCDAKHATCQIREGAI